MSYLVTYGVVALVLWYVGHCVYNICFHPLRAVPGPFLAKLSRWWLFRLEMGGNPHLDTLHLHEIYGPILRISPNEVSFSDLEASGVIYGHTSKFNKAYYFYHAFEDQAPNLFTIRDRQQHSQDKRLISHAFSRANIVQHENLIHENAAYLMSRFMQRADDGQVIPLYPAFRCMTLDTISELAFGKSTGALQLETFDSPILEAIDKATGTVPFFQHFPTLRDFLRWATYCKISAIPNGFLELGQTGEAALEQMHKIETWTMFKNMLSAASKKSTELSKDHLISEAILMFVAGTDTTAASLTLTVHSLLQRPEIYQKLQEEVRTIMPTLVSRPTVHDLDALPFLDACIKEGIRISCPSRFRMPRTVPEGGWNYKGNYFPAGTIVSMSPLYLLLDKAVFPSPTTYDPSRWMVDGELKQERMSYFQPFSRGTRQCIGQNLSLIEQKIVLSTFVRRFNHREVLKTDIEMQEAITAVIADPVNVRLEPVAN